ncbi:MFS transporter [Virgibacillus litoralis]|uniref:MFS family permease n=1 Tax=Virgibacillus litoralis TaxID=578221 RepID=A0ABS4HIU4_9BACI|nr:MFS family permease [Virgibacillus litoralis]
MVFSVLRLRNFRNFFLSEIISGFGVGMSTIGANWFLLDQTNSTKLIGLMLSLNVIAGFLVAPLIGILTDKFNRKVIILWTYLVQSIILIGITSLLSISGFKIEYVYLFAVVNGMGWTTYISTSRSLVQEILSDQDYINGNSLVEISLQVGMFMAGAASGVIYKYFGFDFILIFNATAFIFSSIFLSKVKYNSITIDNKEESYRESFKNGVRYLADRPKIFFLGVVAIIPLASTMMFNVVLPGYVSDTVGGDSIVFGLSDMFYGIGGLLSGFIAAPVAKKISNNSTVILFFWISIGILLSFAFNSYVLVLFLGSVLFGLSNSSLRIVMNTTLMETVSKSFMGRAMSVWMAISLIIQAIASPVLGLLIDKFSPGVGFIALIGLMIIGFIIYFIVIRGVKQNQNTKYVRTG